MSGPDDLTRSAESAAYEDVRLVVALTIWGHTGHEGECPADSAYEPCRDCLRSIFLPAADAVLALPEVAQYDGAQA